MKFLFRLSFRVFFPLELIKSMTLTAEPLTLHLTSNVTPLHVS